MLFRHLVDRDEHFIRKVLIISQIDEILKNNIIKELACQYIYDKIACLQCIFCPTGPGAPTSNTGTVLVAWRLRRSQMTQILSRPELGGHPPQCPGRGCGPPFPAKAGALGSDLSMVWPSALKVRDVTAL